MFQLTDANRKWWTLLAMSSALALVFIDQTALAVALPAMQHELNLSNNALQWVINAYLLTLSALILFGGKLGDSLGHKKIFLWGVSLFISASILCAIAHAGAWLIAARALQGIGGAFMMPSTNTLVANAFPKEERGKALGIYVALAAIFLALGPLLGGALTTWWSWRAVFWINFPIAMTSILLTMSVVPAWRSTKKFTMDYIGLVLAICFITAFVLAFMQGPHWGWTSFPIPFLFVLSFLSFIAFIFWEKRFANPLVEIDLFKNPTFSIVTIVMIILQAISIVLVFWAIFLQNILHYSSLQAGFLLLPVMLPVIFMAPIGGRLRDQYGPKLPMSYGSIIVVFSLIWIGFFSRYQNYLWMFPGFLSYGLGIPLVISGSMATVMSTVNAQQRGIASAILSCARQFGNPIGLAMFASLLSSLNKWQLNTFLRQAPAPLKHIKESQIDGLLVKSTAAIQVLSHLSQPFINLIKSAALQAYTYAFGMTMYVAAGFILVCLLLILKLPSYQP